MNQFWSGFEKQAQKLSGRRLALIAAGAGAIGGGIAGAHAGKKKGNRGQRALRGAITGAVMAPLAAMATIGPRLKPKMIRTGKYYVDEPPVLFDSINTPRPGRMWH